MMEETALVDAIKEAVCFVSGDLRADLAAARAGGHRLEFVLPNGVTNLRGYVRAPGASAPRGDAGAPDQARPPAGHGRRPRRARAGLRPGAQLARRRAAEGRGGDAVHGSAQARARVRRARPRSAGSLPQPRTSCGSERRLAWSIP